MSRRPRLADKLGYSGGMFEFAPLTLTGSAHDAGDTVLSSATITRGSDSPVGMQPSVATIVTRRRSPSWPSSNAGAQLRLTAAFDAWLRDRIGIGPWGGGHAPIRERWTGRVATSTVTDTGDTSRLTWATQVQGTDWLSLLPTIDATATMRKDANDEGKQLTQMFRSLLLRSGLSARFEVLGTRWHHYRWLWADPDIKYFTTDEVLGHFLADLGYLLRTTRAGVVEVVSVDHQRTRADNWQTICPQPLRRAVTLSPVEWDQGATIPRRLAYTLRDNVDENSATTYFITVGSPTEITQWPTESLDFRDVFVIDTIADAMTARVSRAAPDMYRVGEVTVDLPMLIASESVADRDLAAQLLVMQCGDPLVLSHDWPASVRSLYFATQITEHISRSDWRLTFTLAPANHVIGAHRRDALGTPLWDTRFEPSMTWDGTDPLTWDTV